MPTCSASVSTAEWASSTRRDNCPPLLAARGRPDGLPRLAILVWEILAPEDS
jgi:hypothetical protein